MLIHENIRETHSKKSRISYKVIESNTLPAYERHTIFLLPFHRLHREWSEHEQRKKL